MPPVDMRATGLTILSQCVKEPPDVPGPERRRRAGRSANGFAQYGAAHHTYSRRRIQASVAQPQIGGK